MTYDLYLGCDFRFVIELVGGFEGCFQRFSSAASLQDMLCAVLYLLDFPTLIAAMMSYIAITVAMIKMQNGTIQQSFEVILRGLRPSAL